MSLYALAEMSDRYGANEEFATLGSGNTSFKDGDVMYVKASGSPLAGISTEGFVALNLPVLKAALELDIAQDPGPAQGPDPAQAPANAFDAILKARLPGQESKRPSVESLLHALFPYKYALHLHPVIVNGLTCSAEFEDTSRRLFPTGVCVPSMPPGPGPARLCGDAIAKTSGGECPQIVFLQHHGIIVSADTVGGIDDIMTTVIDTLTCEIKEFPDLTDPQFTQAGIEKYRIRDNPLTIEQIIYPDDETVLKNAVKIAVYAQSFGGVTPLPQSVTGAMKDFNPYKI